MSQEVDVSLTLTHFTGPTQDTVVVLDILRASTTMVKALANGAQEVWPCGTLEEALAMRKAAHRPSLLAGERGGLPPPGFDLGNSPSAFTPELISGKSLYFTTTNGTQAIARAKDARRLLIGCLHNFTAVAQCALQGKGIHLLCAGTDGHVSAEDVCVAGWLVERLIQLASASGNQLRLTDSAELSRLAALGPMRTSPTDHPQVAARFLQSRGGRNLEELGLSADVWDAARCDVTTAVPQLDSRGALVLL